MPIRVYVFLVPDWQQQKENMKDSKNDNKLASKPEKKSRKKPRRRFVPVHIKTSPKDNKVVLNQEICYKDVIVPKGYKSDGLTKILNKYPPNCARAYFVHDLICEGVLSMKTGRKIPRKTGDIYFKEILKLDGVGKFKINRMYWAISAFRILTFKK